MEKKAFYGLDVMKFISAFLVICIHTGPLLDMHAEANFIVVQIVSRVAVPFFFVASGFLFFQKIEFMRCWNEHDNVHHLRRYIVRLCKLYCIWTILYLPFTYILLREGNGLTYIGLLRYVRDFFLNGSYYHLWFLPALMFCVPFVYICICKWGMAITLIIGCILYGIGMGINVYAQGIEMIPGLNRVLAVYLSICSTARNGLFFGTIYVAMGALFAYRPFYFTKKQVAFGFIITTMLYVVECYVLKKYGFMNALTSMYGMLPLCLFFLFLILIRIDIKERAIFKIMRRLSLLLYVSHIMFLLSINWMFPTMHSFLVYLFTAVCSLAFSIFVYKVSQTIRFLKYVYE